MNQILLVGRLTDTPEILSTENNSRTIINLAVPRSYKNQEGIYETDFIRCILWNGLAKRVKEYCKKGDLVGIKGRLQVRNYIDEKEEKKYISEVMVESITFLSSTKLE